MARREKMSINMMIIGREQIEKKSYEMY